MGPAKFWRQRTPTVIQMENAECGAACLSMILSYYGRFVPLEKLRLECGISRDGSNALNLINCAKGYGLDAKGRREGLSEIYQLDKPAILYWDYNHFVVLEGFGKDKVFLNDPSFGPRTVTYEEFDQGYTGIVIHLTLTDQFEKGGVKPSVIRDLMKRLKPVKKSIYYIILTGFCLLIPGLSLPVFLRIFIDNVLVTNILPWKGGFLLAIGCAMLMGGVLTWLQQYYLNRLNTKLSVRFSSDFLWHILRLPISFYYQRYPAEIASRMSLNNQVSKNLTGPLATTLISLFLVVFYGIVMFLYDVTVAGIGILAGIGSLLVMRRIQRSRTDIYARLQKEQSQALANTIGSIQQIETIKATGSESDAFTSFVGLDTNKINSLQQINRKDAILANSPLLFQGIALAALMGFGGWRVMTGDLSIGTLIALQMLLVSFLTPILQFVNFGQIIQFVKVDLTRLNDVLDNPIDRLYVKGKRSDEHTKKVKLDGYLEFKNVTFGYSPLAPPLVKNLCIKMKPGQRVALVGPSGCGKSTISKLATGLLDPWEGEILFDGVPFLEHSREIIQRSLASVDQEIFLFGASIQDNITLWNPTVPDDMLVQAAQDASIHQDILERPAGYDTKLIEGGKNLSGGQRQRIEIARALLYGPTILIMDEATSALDSNTEKIIMHNIRRRGCSAIMVAHRLSTIQDCDEIIVLDEGKVIERGTHEELKQKEGTYFELTEIEKVQNGE